MLFKEEDISQKIREKLNTAWINIKLVDEHYNSYIRNTCFLAGGAIRDIARGVEPNDYDIYFKTDVSNNEYVSIMLTRNGFTKSEIGTWCKDNVQFITCVSGSPKDVVKTFDFTINAAYYDFNNSSLVGVTTGKELLYLENCRKPVAALIRVAKFTQMGYTIDQDNLAKLAASIVQIDAPKTYEAIKELFRVGSMDYKSTVDNMFYEVQKIYLLEKQSSVGISILNSDLPF